MRLATIDLVEYQRQVRDGMFTKDGVDQLAHAALGLAAEAGEVADLVKKSQYRGRTLDVEKLIEESGDTLWYLTYILNLAIPQPFGIEQLAYSNILKLENRHGRERYRANELLGTSY